MKYLLTYNESFNNDGKLQNLLQKFGKSVDTKKLLEVLEPYKDKLRKIATKYTVDGKIDARLIEKDIKNFGFSTNEALGDNVVIRLLVGLINLPINLVRIIFYFFKDMWDNADWTRAIRTFIVAIMIFVLSFSIYQIGEHAMNGISVGIINTEVEFIPEHEETTTHYYTDSDGKEQSYTTTETIPDTWKTDVRASNGRIETWKTTDHNTGVNAHKEDVVRKTEEWEWEATKEYGEKMGGGFSGGGAGESY
jgi:hypothetical protein